MNLCRDRARRKRVRSRHVEAGPVPVGSPNPEDAAVARATIEAALAELPPRRRAVIVLHELEDRSTEQISELLGVSRVTVRWHLAAGRRDLRRLLAGPKDEGAGSRA